MRAFLAAHGKLCNGAKPCSVELFFRLTLNCGFLIFIRDGPALRAIVFN